MGLISFTASHLDEALNYLHSYGDETTILAGGTDVLVRYHDRLTDLPRVLNIYNLDELKMIKVNDNQIEIGSLVTHSQLEESAIILNHAPILAEAAATVGSPQIRNRGTIGGNVANASPAADLMPPLMALDGQIKLVSLDRGERVLPLEDFILGPGRIAAKKDELITAFVFNIPKENYRSSFVKLGYRKALAISTVNVAVHMALYGGMVQESRIVLGAVGPTPIRARLTEEVLKGKLLTDELLHEALKQVSNEVSPISDIRGTRQYRLDMSRELVERGIRNILQKGGRRK